MWLGIQKGKQESPERKTQRQVFRQGSLETFTARSPRNSGETGVGILILLIFCHVYGSMKKKKKKQAEVVEKHTLEKTIEE